MTQQDNRLEQLLTQIRQAPGLEAQLPETEAQVIRQALQGLNIYELAQQNQMSEGAVWSALTSAARLASGRPGRQVEVGGGLGSDLSPGEDRIGP